MRQSFYCSRMCFSLLLCCYPLLMYAQSSIGAAGVNRDRIHCIKDSKEETALQRWLECLEPSASSLSEYHQHVMATIGKVVDSGADVASEFDRAVVDGAAGSSYGESLEHENSRVLADGDLLALTNAPDVGSHSVEVEEGAAAAESGSRAQNDEGRSQDLHDDLSSQQVSIGSKEVQNTDDILWNVIKMNMGLIALAAILAKMLQKQQKRSSDRLERIFDSSDVQSISNSSKAPAVFIPPSNFLAPLGSAVGAVLAEVLLHASCNHGAAVPAAEDLSMLLESAMKESLPQVDFDEPRGGLRDFLASFQTTYKTIHKVRKALGASHQGFGDVTSSCCDMDHGRPKRGTRLCDCNSDCETLTPNGQESHEAGTNILSWKQAASKLGQGQSGRKLSFCSMTGTNNDSIEDLLSSKQAEEWPNTSVLSMTGTNNDSIEDLLSSKQAEEAEERPNTSTSILQCGDEHLQLRFSYGSKAIVGGNCSAGWIDEQAVPSLLSDNKEDTRERSIGGVSGHVRGNSSGEQSEALELTAGMLSSLVLAGSKTQEASHFGWQKAFLHMFEKSVRAQEHHNYIKTVELAHLFKRLTLNEEQLQLTSEANNLMRENLKCSKLKLSFKERIVLNRQLDAAQIAFARTCADELVAGLFVMLVGLAYAVRHHSFALLSDVVSTCHTTTKEPRRSSGFHIDWLYNSLDSMAAQLHAFTCQVTVAGRIFIGLLIVGVVAASLLRQSVTSSSQSMPATILIIVLGGICGFAGKLSVDSLGGNGLLWLLFWEIFCVVHAIATCFTPSVYRILYGPSFRRKSRLGIPFWLRKVSFHVTIVLVLPILAGQLPFVPLSTVTNDLLSIIAAVTYPVFSPLQEALASQPVIRGVWGL